MNNDNANDGKKLRGFANLSTERVKEISRKGGIASHAQGKAYEYDTAAAREAGRKGGIASAEKKRLAREEANSRTPMSSSLLADSLLAD